MQRTRFSTGIGNALVIFLECHHRSPEGNTAVRLRHVKMRSVSTLSAMTRAIKNGTIHFSNRKLRDNAISRIVGIALGRPMKSKLIPLGTGELT
ncbi:MAG: hypothetical protein ABI905_18000 [Betaproteobacteria bacterium]